MSGAAKAGRLEGKVVLITGAAAGIGLAVARDAVAEGARVVLVDRDGAKLEEAAAPFGTACVTLAADVSDPAAGPAYVQAALDRFGRLDAAVLNAGIAGRVAPIEAVTVEEFDRMMAVNVRGTWLGMAAVFPVMKAAGGSIVALASMGGLMGSPYLAPYIASKHAVIGLVRTAAIEGARHGIRVNAVCPAPIDTAMMAGITAGLNPQDAEAAYARAVSVLPMRRYGTPDEVAKLVTYLASADSSFTTGSVYPVDGGLGAGIYRG